MSKTKQVPNDTFVSVWTESIRRGVSPKDIAMALGMKSEQSAIGKAKRLNEAFEEAGMAIRLPMPLGVSKKRGRKPLSEQIGALATLIESLTPAK